MTSTSAYNSKDDSLDGAVPSTPEEEEKVSTYHLEKQTITTADKDLLVAAEMGDHNALMKAIEDGAWWELNP